jgi:hypothetical protein
MERFWTNALQGSDVVVSAGAIVVDQNGYDNVMLEVGGEGESVLYRERMPVGPTRIDS